MSDSIEYGDYPGWPISIDQAREGQLLTHIEPCYKHKVKSERHCAQIWTIALEILKYCGVDTEGLPRCCALSKSPMNSLMKLYRERADLPLKLEMEVSMDDAVTSKLVNDYIYFNLLKPLNKRS